MFPGIVQKTGSILLLGGVLLVGLPACATRDLSDWTRVQSVPPETRTEVQLYRDEATAENWKIQGHFHSATDDSVTLKIENRQTRIFQKKVIFKVLISRPPSKKEMIGMLIGNVAGVLIGAAVFSEKDLAPHLAAIPTASALVYFLSSRMKEVYKASPRSP